MTEREVWNRERRRYARLFFCWGLAVLAIWMGCAIFLACVFTNYSFEEKLETEGFAYWLTLVRLFAVSAAGFFKMLWWLVIPAVVSLMVAYRLFLDGRKWLPKGR